MMAQLLEPNLERSLLFANRWAVTVFILHFVGRAFVKKSTLIFSWKTDPRICLFEIQFGSKDQSRIISCLDQVSPGFETVLFSVGNFGFFGRPRPRGRDFGFRNSSNKLTSKVFAIFTMVLKGVSHPDSICWSHRRDKP